MKYLGTHINPLGIIILSATKFGLMYFASLILSPAILISFAYIVIAAINITYGNVSLEGVSPLAGFFGVPESGNFSFDENDILSVFWKLAFVLTIFSFFFTSLINKLTSYKFEISEKRRLKLGIIILTSLMLIAQASAYMPNLDNGAKSIWFVLLIFWAIGIISYLLFICISYLVNKLHFFEQHNF